MSAKAKEFVDALIASKPVVVFSKTYCPYCTKAKKALESFKLSPDAFECVELEARPDMNEIQDYLGQLTGARSVPRVFIGGRFLGGGDDTARAASDGRLAQLLANAGALH